MALLFDEDYELLRAQGILWEEDEGQRLLVLRDFPLPETVYTAERADILVVIPPNYNQGGNDMFWTFPRLVRRDGRPIELTSNAGEGDNRQFNGREFCRWSRHWFDDMASRWRPGIDNAETIVRRVSRALQKS